MLKLNIIFFSVFPKNDELFEDYLTRCRLNRSKTIAERDYFLTYFLMI